MSVCCVCQGSFGPAFFSQPPPILPIPHGQRGKPPILSHPHPLLHNPFPHQLPPGARPLHSTSQLPPPPQHPPLPTSQHQAQQHSTNQHPPATQHQPPLSTHHAANQNEGPRHQAANDSADGGKDTESEKKTAAMMKSSTEAFIPLQVCTICSLLSPPGDAAAVSRY
jgi:hypothetical protein